MKVDGDLLRRIAPRTSGARTAGQAAIIDAIGPTLQEILSTHQIDTPLRAAHFLAQICFESDGFCTTTEYASGTEYEGRADLGNSQPGDGARFKGRGLIQLSGRANYSSYGMALGLDLVGRPELVGYPPTALQIAAEYWTKHGLNALADKDDIETITRRINGGLSGLNLRRNYLEKAKAALSSSTRGSDV